MYHVAARASVVQVVTMVTRYYARFFSFSNLGSTWVSLTPLPIAWLFLDIPRKCPWALPVEGRYEPGGWNCWCFSNLCRKHSKDKHNHAGTWTEKPLSCIRKDMLKCYSKSVMHHDSQHRELTLTQSQHDGGIWMAFKADAMKVVYWLCK